MLLLQRSGRLRLYARELPIARAFADKAYPKFAMEGKPLPDVTLKALEKDNKLVDVKLRDKFAGKRVVLFSLPGAFTPTCSNSHLPDYLEKSAEVKALGVDEIACMSVNDAFVMRGWGKAQNVDPEKITLLADGNADFTKKMGMDCDKSAIGFGTRSWRYSMFVDDNIIKKIFAEPPKDGDPFEVSDVFTMLQYLKVAAKK